MNPTAKVRFLVQQVESSTAAHVGGPVHTRFVTIEAEAPQALLDALAKPGTDNSVLGVEVIYVP